MTQILSISLGAMLGANLRFFVSVWASQRLGIGFPFGTLLVNVGGCFLIGLFYGLGETRLTLTPELRLFFVVGFLGAFTTFSSFGNETVNLMRSGDLWLALLNIAGNNLFGLLAVMTGAALARLLA
ncbi:MAG: fluoride efflux transporter CrcB [Caldilinea sp.]|uniref:fluoride efflux transporter CrcB n=1 Tax=Caldilinea sp. TaxID=2293560 RepID=UPI002CD86542|nr:fluoride efflux transporter CrcB [Anaerolineales bacterium]HQY90302.1 fluoride efflux transporter CrcB [Caldilinea sp.]HRA66643.1 fluoride efflux transporter CrcB [Caldilinea sp.]